MAVPNYQDNLYQRPGMSQSRLICKPINISKVLHSSEIWHLNKLFQTFLLLKRRDYFQHTPRNHCM